MFKTFLIATLLLSIQAGARPLPKTKLTVQSLPLTMTTDYNFEGIVALNNCSGSLIRLENARDTDRALVLTNGHCLESGMPRQGTYVYGKASSRRFKLLNSDASSAGTVSADLIVYGTMTKTDMSIYRLKETYAEILSDYGIHPLALQKTRSTEGTRMEVISGYWRRGYACNIEKFIPKLKEGQWTCDDSIRYSRPGCETIGGTSGSPILQAGTRAVIGVNNTGNEDGESCTDNNPCEIDEKGNITQVQGYSYGQQTYWVYSCLNANNEFDLSVPGCPLKF